MFMVSVVLVSTLASAHAKPNTERFGSIAEARTSTDNAVVAIEAAAKEVPALVAKQGAEAAKLKELDARAKALNEERERILEEAKNGFVCSECRRTPTQIMAEEHETFEAHLTRVTGKKQVKATTEDIDKIKKKYQAKLDEVKQQADGVTRNLREVKAAIDTHYENAKRAFLFYMAIVPEIDAALRKDAEATRKRDTAAIDSVVDEIKRADSELEKLKYKELSNRAARDELLALRDSLKLLVPRFEKERDAHTFAANRAQAQWAALKQGRADHLRDLMDRLAIPSLSLPPKLFAPGGTPIELAIKGTPVTFKIDEYGVGVGVELGKLEATLSVETDPLGMEGRLKACIEAAGVASACMVRDPRSPNLDLGVPVIEVGGIEIKPGVRAEGSRPPSGAAVGGAK